MATILTSKIAPLTAKIRFKGVLEAAYVLRLLLQQKPNAEIRLELARLFGPQWNKANQERRYFDLLRTYVKLYHEADYVRFMLKEDLKIKPSDQKNLRNTLVRYLITVQGLHGGSEVVNDLG